MTMPELTVVAQGTLPTGERWAVRAGGTDQDYCTFLRTVHPDGRQDEGGMGGPKLPDDAIASIYIGQADGGLLRVLARTISVIHWMRLELGSGDLPPAPEVAKFEHLKRALSRSSLRPGG